MTIDWFLHLANIIYLVSYLVRDILWLRVLTVIAISAMMPYYYCCHAEPMYMPIGWNSLFLTVNLVQIAILILERRPVFLGDEELAIYRTVFRSLRPREFVKLLSVAEWKKAKPGEVLLEQGKPIPALMLVSSGTGTVKLDGRHVAEIQSGQFVGEMGFLTGQVASARVQASAAAEYLSWPVAKLRNLLANTPELHVKVQAILGSDLVGKLRREAQVEAHPSMIETVLRDAGMQ